MLVIIPVYHKIRLTFIEVYRWVTVFLPALRYHFGNVEPLEWDVYLTFSNDLKGLMRKSALRKDEFLESLLVDHHPRFIWRAILKFGEVKLVELLFDATGFAKSFPLYRVVWHNEDFALKMKWLLEHPKSFRNSQWSRIAENQPCQILGILATEHCGTVPLVGADADICFVMSASTRSASDGGSQNTRTRTK